MASSTEKERLRRLAIEESWVAPDDIEARHASRDDERPATAGHILKAILAIQGDRPFEIEEWSKTGHDLPKWAKTNPDDVHLSFAAKPITVYHLAGLREIRDGEISAFEVMYLDGKSTTSRLGIGQPTGRGIWHHYPVASLARTIREHRA